MAFNITVPTWLAALISAIAGYLRGRADQAEADQEATQKADASAEATVEDAARQVGAMSDDDVQKELDQWRTP